MKTNFENSNWELKILGDHALVFCVEEKMSEEIIENIMALKKTIEAFHFDFIKELIPSYHTLTLVYDVDLFYQNEIATINNHSITDVGNDMLTAFNSDATNSTIKNAAEKIIAAIKTATLIFMFLFSPFIGLNFME
jgi:allophanate hydrolase subunit 1